MLSYLSTMLGKFKGIIQSAAICNTSAWVLHSATAAKHFMEEHKKDQWLQDHEFKQVLWYFQEKKIEQGNEFYNLFCSKGENLGHQWIAENMLKTNLTPTPSDIYPVM